MKFYHYHPKPNGGVTIAYQIQEHENGKNLSLSIAQCSKKDNYCKQKGREKALEKWNLNNNITMVVKGSYKNINKRVEAKLGFLAHALYTMGNT